MNTIITIIRYISDGGGDNEPLDHYGSDLEISNIFLDSCLSNSFIKLAGATISCSLYSIASGKEVEPFFVIVVASIFVTLIASISK